MKRRTINKQGLAIITTLLILSLLLALIAAFLVVNRAGNRFTVGSVDRRTAQDVCLTAFNYAWYKLEQDRAWGDGTVAVTGNEQYPLVNAQVQLSHTQVQGEQLLTINGLYSQSGNFTEPEGTFTMTVENNLQGRKPTDTGVTVNVPSRAVRIEVVANVGGVTKTLRTLLRPTPISHESMAAGGDIDLASIGSLRLESRDPYVNRIVAGENMSLPEADDVQFLKHGIAASGGDELNLGSTNLAGASDDVVRTAGETSGGVYMPKAEIHTAVEEFDPDEITLPNLTTSIPDGTWTFGEVTAIDYIPHTLQYATPPPGPLADPGVESTIRYQRKTSQYNQLTSPTGQVYTAGQAMEGTEVLDPPYDPSSGVYPSEGAAESYGYGDTSDATNFSGTDVVTLAPGFKANITTAQMVVHPEYALQVPGDFFVEAEGARQPELYFGYDLSSGGVANQLSLVDGLEAAQNDPGKYMAGIIADGDVNVVGGVLGYGSMIAGGDLTIKASSGLRVAPDLGVVVKGNRVIVNPATEPEPEQPGEPIKVDYPIFRDAITEESEGDWTEYNGWLDHNQPTRNQIVADLGATSTGEDPTVLWNAVCDEIGVTLPAPDFTGTHGWPAGAATVEQYVRLKEFAQTQASGYNGGAGDETWLDLSQRTEDAGGRVSGVLNGIAQWANSFKLTFQDYLTNPQQAPPDMFLEGLIYADEDLIVNANGKTVRLEGTVVAQNGGVTINDASHADLIYDRSLVDDLTASAGTGNVRLEKVFFTLD